MALVVAVEDDLDVAGVLAASLRSSGHTVRLADSGRHAIDLADWRRPDLVIMDHRMPGMTGLDLARVLRADAATASVPLMMFAAEPPVAALDVVDRVVQKPVSMRTVVTIANELLVQAPAALLPVGAALSNRSRVRAVGRLLDRTDPVAARTLSALAAELAAQTGAAVAAVTLVLPGAVVYVASFGLPEPLASANGVPAEWAPCSLVIAREEPVLIADTHGNPASLSNPVVTHLGVRSYAGVPLHDTVGLPVGTLCVLDRKPFAFTERTLELLTTAAAHAQLLLTTVGED